tara:strand:- start:254 stop:1249 length:996 start_codon:yes stop_codon:yes gene_type:complete
MRILFGFYSGIGDLLSAIPIINNVKTNIKVSIAITENLIDVLKIFDVRYDSLIVFDRSKLSRANIKFSKSLNDSPFDYIVYSPHATYEHSSFYLPILLKIFKNPSTKIIGAKHQKNSWLFDETVEVKFMQKCSYREYDLVNCINIIEDINKDSLCNFTPTMKKYTSEVNKNNSICLHIGASRKSKRLSDKFWSLLIKKFYDNTDYKLRIIGLEQEISSLREMLSGLRNKVDFFSGNMEESVKILSQSEFVITMDSGFGHIASLMRLNHFCIFVSSSPLMFAPIFSNTKILYKPGEPCQPCLSRTCYESNMYCLANLEPNHVYNHIVTFMRK